MMRYACTICCAAKRRDPEPLPAIERYLDPRIRHIGAHAASLRLPLLILSGRFGLVTADEAIPWYDQALTTEQVADLVPHLVEQLQRHRATGLVFFALPTTTPGWEPYHRALAEACERAGVALEIQPLPATVRLETIHEKTRNKF